MIAIWQRRSKMGLIGYEIDVETGEWLDPASTVGAGADSFFEYLLKGYIMFGDPDLHEMYKEAKKALNRWSLNQFGQYVTVGMASGRPRTFRQDALGAFLPGLLVLEGDLNGAIAAFDAYYLAMMRYGDGKVLPEAFDIGGRRVLQTEYNLRPELVESAYYLYQATGDEWYMSVGQRYLNAIEQHCRTPCGFAVLHHTDKQGDRMESFLLSETFKYMYLLFTPDHWVNRTPGVVFTTEGHILKISGTGKTSCLPCPMYQRPQSLEDDRLWQQWNTGMVSSEDTSHLSLTSKQVCENRSYSEKTVVDPSELVYCRDSVGKIRSIRLEAWPQPSNPSYWAVRLGKKVTVTREEQVVLLTRIETRARDWPVVAKTLDETWSVLENRNAMWTPKFVDFQGKCPHVLIPTFIPSAPLNEGDGLIESTSMANLIAEVGVTVALRTFASQPKQVVYAGLPVTNLFRSNVPDYLFDHLIQ